MERVMITLPQELVEAVDDCARRLATKRSRVVRQALQEWLERQRRSEFEALLAEGYQEMAGELAAIAADFEPLQAIVAEQSWHWDE